MAAWRRLIKMDDISDEVEVEEPVIQQRSVSIDNRHRGRERMGRETGTNIPRDRHVGPRD